MLRNALPIVFAAFTAFACNLPQENERSESNTPPEARVDSTLTTSTSTSTCGEQCDPLPACNAQTCPNGCCNGNVCEAGNVTNLCGRGGEACRICVEPNGTCS